jgi:pimeloyl-ACP methyl ester carboxylesterase
MAGIWNHRAALDVMQAMQGVDAERIGVIGHSLGGHNALFLAAFDDRVKVIVSSCGYAPFRSHDRNVRISAWSHSGYMPRIKNVYDCDPNRMPFDFPELVAALAPRPFFTNAPLHDFFDCIDVKTCLESARESYREFDAEDRLQAIHPDCEHDFPAEARDAAYAFLDRWL